MFLHAGAEENSFLGPLRHRVIEPAEFGVDGVAVNAGTEVNSRQVAIAGFLHHQICFQTNITVTSIRIAIAFGRFVGAGFTSNSQTRKITLQTVQVTDSNVYFSVYFGINRPISDGAAGEFRFSTTILIGFVNTSGSNAIITGWLESMS